MKIIEITDKNFQTFKTDLIELNDSFLQDLDVIQDVNIGRTPLQKEAILKNMIRANSPTHLLIGLDNYEKAVGMTYFNEGTGYSCGGDYIWMNSIYVKPEEQQKGYGSLLLKYVENWATQKGFKLFVCSRHVHNEKSEKLFAKNGFEQSNNISIEKTLHFL